MERSPKVVSSARPDPTKEHDAILHKHAEHQKATQQAEWEVDESKKYEAEQALKEASEAILDPKNVIELKRQLVGLEMAIKNYTTRRQELYRELVSVENEKIETPELDEWERGWREKAENAKEHRAQNIREKMDRLDAQDDELDDLIRNRVEKYIETLDPEGVVPIDGDALHNANQDLIDKLDKMLDLSFKQLQELAEAKNKPDKNPEDAPDDEPEEVNDKLDDDDPRYEENEKYKELYALVLDQTEIDWLLKPSLVQARIDHAANPGKLDEVQTQAIDSYVTLQLLSIYGAREEIIKKVPDETTEDLIEKVRQAVAEELKVSQEDTEEAARKAAEEAAKVSGTTTTDPPLSQRQKDLDEHERKTKEWLNSDKFKNLKDKYAEEAAERMEQIQREEEKKAKLHAEIDAADNLWMKRRDRAERLREIATANNSLEAADRILSKKRWINLLRMPENDKIARNKALETIAKNNKDADPKLALEAARKINNRYIRNQTLKEIGKANMSSGERDKAVQIAGTIKGPGHRELRRELLVDIALSYEDAAEAVNFVKGKIKDNATRDDAFVELVKKYRDGSLIRQIKRAGKKHKAQIELNKLKGARVS